MDAAVRMNNVIAVAKESLDIFISSFDTCLKESLVHSLHPTVKDALVELSRSELTFLMLLNSLSKRDVQMSCIFLQAVEDLSVFPRVVSYLTDKLRTEWDIPDDLINNAIDFAEKLQRSGLVKVPDSVTKYFALLAFHMKLEDEDESEAGTDSEDELGHEMSDLEEDEDDQEANLED